MGCGGSDLSKEEICGWSEASDMMAATADFQFVIVQTGLSFLSSIS